MITKFFLFFFPIITFSQVAIGKESIEGSGMLDFAPNLKRGIVLPWTNIVSNPTGGTITYDRNSKLVTYFNGNSWVNMTDGGLASLAVNTDPDIGGGVIIGADSSVAKGVLVLESTSRSLILPKVDNVATDIFNPAPGTICYDLATNSLAVFNGTVWAFWK